MYFILQVQVGSSLHQLYNSFNSFSLTTGGKSHQCWVSILWDEWQTCVQYDIFSNGNMNKNVRKYPYSKGYMYTQYIHHNCVYTPKSKFHESNHHMSITRVWVTVFASACYMWVLKVPYPCIITHHMTYVTHVSMYIRRYVLWLQWNPSKSWLGHLDSINSLAANTMFVYITRNIHAYHASRWLITQNRNCNIPSVTDTYDVCMYVRRHVHHENKSPI